MSLKLLKYLSAKLRRRQQTAARFEALRSRDGDDCRRCRRPLRFDLPRGHELAPVIERIVTAAAEECESLANLCLCHGRCNAPGQDHTGVALERLRPQREAELLSRARSRKAAA